MNFCQNYFSKDLDQLTESDLVAFFSTPQKETQYIEFKSSGETNVEQVFNKTLKPAVCSFLNSEGGILIYGAPREDRRNLENPENFKLRPYPPKFLGDHDSIIRKIADGITPMPIGVRLKEVEVEAGMVAVFEIQESQSKPHQTDNIYQIRIDGQKKPAPHYLIEAMMKQVRFPEIKIFFKVEKAVDFPTPPNGILIKLSVIVVNFTEFINEKNLRIRIGVDGDCFISKSNYNERTKSIDYQTLETISFGEPIELEYSIFTSFLELRKTPIIQIISTYHGDTCPSKVNIFTIDGGQISFAKDLTKENRHNHIVKNLLFSEHQKNLGQTHIEAISKSYGIKIE